MVHIQVIEIDIPILLGSFVIFDYFPALQRPNVGCVSGGAVTQCGWER